MLFKTYFKTKEDKEWLKRMLQRWGDLMYDIEHIQQGL